MSRLDAAAKDALRREMRRLRAAADPAALHTASQTIAGHLRTMPALARARCIGAYLAQPREPSLDALLAEWDAAGKAIQVPAFDPVAGAYRMAIWRPGTPLRAGPHGIREPAAPAWAGPNTAEAMLVPGLAFDAQGNRLGHGGGVFDRLLAGFQGVRFGVCFSFQRIDRVPANAQDQPMHAVLTPEGAHWAPHATPLSYP